MTPEEARYGPLVRVTKDHRPPEHRGLFGRVAGLYGNPALLVVDVRFPGGEQRLFHPGDLAEEGKVKDEPSWLRMLLGSA